MMAATGEDTPCHGRIEADTAWMHMRLVQSDAAAEDLRKHIEQIKFAMALSTHTDGKASFFNAQ